MQGLRRIMARKNLLSCQVLPGSAAIPIGWCASAKSRFVMGEIVELDGGVPISIEENHGYTSIDGV